MNTQTCKGCTYLREAQAKTFCVYNAPVRREPSGFGGYPRMDDSSLACRHYHGEQQEEAAQAMANRIDSFIKEMGEPAARTPIETPCPE